MRRAFVVLGVILLLIPAIALFNSAEPETRTVYVVGPGRTYETIGDALTAAIDGDTVHVLEGVYNESFYIYAEIELIGAGMGNTTIHSASYNPTINVMAPNVTISGFHFSCDLDWYAGVEFNADNGTVHNCSFQDHYDGVSIDYASNTTIKDCIFNRVGGFSIYSYYSDNVTIEDCTIRNSYYDGFYVSFSRDVHVRSCSFTNCSTDGISFADSSNSSVTDCTFTDNKRAMDIRDSYNITLHGNLLYDGSIEMFGDYVHQWDSHTIGPDNLFEGKPIQYVVNANDTTVPTGAGQIIMVNSQRVTVQNQHISDATEGMTLAFCDFCTVQRNTFRRSIYDAVYIYESNHNMIMYNRFINNSRYAISFGYGSTKNQVVLNDFISNNDYGRECSDSGWDNLYNLTDAGNYWSDHSNIDLNSDGIADETFSPALYEYDHYPLTHPFAAPWIYTEDEEFAYQNVHYSVKYDAIDRDTSPAGLIWNLTTNATWLTLDAANQLKGTPTGTDVGVYFVNVSVMDGTHWDSHEFTLTVKMDNEDPSIVTGHITSIRETEYYYNDYDALDPDHTTFTWTLLTSAMFLTINETTGELYGRPDDSDVGVHSVMVMVTDPLGAFDSVSFNLTVIEANFPPHINWTITSLMMDEDTISSIDLYQVFTDLDGDVLNFSVYTVGVVNYTLHDNGTLDLIPPPNWHGGQGFVVTANDTLSEVSWEFTISVMNVNDPIAGVEIYHGEHYETLDDPNPIRGTIYFDEFDFVYLIAVLDDPDGSATYSFEWRLNEAVVDRSIEFDHYVDPGTHSLTFMAEDESGYRVYANIILIVEEDPTDPDDGSSSSGIMGCSTSCAVAIVTLVIIIVVVIVVLMQKKNTANTDPTKQSAKDKENLRKLEEFTRKQKEKEAAIEKEQAEKDKAREKSRAAADAERDRMRGIRQTRKNEQIAREAKKRPLDERIEYMKEQVQELKAEAEEHIEIQVIEQSEAEQSDAAERYPHLITDGPPVGREHEFSEDEYL